MRIPGIKTGGTFLRWLRAQVYGAALILGYHRVAPAENDVYDVCITDSHFAQHLEILRKCAHLLSLAELVQHLERGTVPRAAVCITFDDGYADVLESARPLLERHEIPATVFVSTDPLGSKFWWDELRWLIQSPSALPGSLEMSIGTGNFEWSAPALNRNELIKALHLRLYLLNPDDRELALHSLREWSMAKPYDMAQGRALTVEELARLAGSSLVEVGSHSSTHPVLPSLSLEEQEHEISMSRKRLEGILDRPVLGFSYPDGLSTAETRRIVRESGYRYACSSRKDSVRLGADMYSLPRFWPPDTDGDRFLRGLMSWVH